MKLLLTDAHSELSYAILQNVSQPSEYLRTGKACDLTKEICDNDICVVVKAAQTEEILVNDKLRDKKLEERLQNIIITAGIPPHVIGFRFLRDAIRASVQNPDLINRMTKGLYPEVAAKNMTSASKVERAIRHAIDVSWQREKIENINNALGIKVFQKGDKPTNSELIALIADRLLVEFGA